MIEYSQNFIGGRRVDASSAERLDVRFSYDDSLVGRVPLAQKADIDLAVSVARRAFDQGPWPRMDIGARCAVLARFAELHAARCSEFAQFISGENATPTWFTHAVQQGVAYQNAAYLEAAQNFDWEKHRPAFGGQNNTVLRHEAVGVVAAIIPWNAPHQSALVKLFPALLAGCSVILKLAPETALDGQFLGELFMEAGLPEDVLSIIVADREVSEYLVAHPDIDKVAFTGSTATGQRIAAIAGAQLKRMSFELGGKSAALLLPDAPFEIAAQSVRYSAMLGNGQSCVAQTRILVPRDRHDHFVAALVADVESLTIGDPRQMENFIGPLVSTRQQDRVTGYIALGIEEGATVATGGLGMPAGLDHGAFVKPTVFAKAHNQMRIAREEIFGPVVCVIPYDSVEEAISIANDSPFGLSGGIWSADPEAALAAARRIRTGGISINGAHPDFSAPFGGFKQSGMGREFGAHGISAYVEAKAITL